jgi:lipopolysaccharide transport system ATP-binding protein
MTINTPTLLTVSQVNKSFQLYQTAADRLKERLFSLQRHTQHHALIDINFSLRAGESLAIIGQNGAGKSTLLKLITGVMLPDHGVIEHFGRITGLLELGTGFDPTMTGRDNISINGQLIGMTQAEIEQQCDDIIAFAELGEYIDAPVKTYSSGMLMRLGFAVAIHANPACFVVDEALAVGDARFQQKCLTRIRQFRQQGGALLFVSHDLAAIKQLCDRAIVLNKGRVTFDGDTLTAVNTYNQQLANLGPASQANGTNQGFGHQQVRITGIQIIGEHGQSEDFATGEQLNIYVDIHASKAMDDMTIGFLIRDRFGNDAFGTNTHLLNQPLSQPENSNVRYRFRLPLNLGHGKYTLTLAVHSGSHHHDECQHWLDDVCVFRITGNNHLPFSGYCYLPTQFEVSPQQECQ